MTTTTTPTLAIPRALFIYALFYGGMTCIAGVLGFKLVAFGPQREWAPGIGPFGVEAGIFAFLFLVVVSSAVAELYGRKIANLMVVLGFIPLVASMILILLVLALPPAGFFEEERRKAFALVLGQNVRMMGAGIISYGTSQLLNVFLFTKIKGAAEGRFIWLRSLVSSVLSQVTDTFIFITISFAGVLPLWQVMEGQLVAKIILSAVFVPPLIMGFVKLGQRLDQKPLA